MDNIPDGLREWLFFEVKDQDGNWRFSLAQPRSILVWTLLIIVIWYLVVRYNRTHHHQHHHHKEQLDTVYQEMTEVRVSPRAME